MAQIELEGIPRHAWGTIVAADLLRPHCSVESIDLDTAVRRNLSVFRFTARTTQPEFIPESSVSCSRTGVRGVAVLPYAQHSQVRRQDPGAPVASVATAGLPAKLPAAHPAGVARLNGRLAVEES